MVFLTMRTLLSFELMENAKLQRFVCLYRFEMNNDAISCQIAHHIWRFFIYKIFHFCKIFLEEGRSHVQSNFYFSGLNKKNPPTDWLTVTARRLIGEGWRGGGGGGVGQS